MHELMEALRAVVARYEAGDELVRKVFTELVVSILKAIGRDDLAHQVERGKRTAYDVAKEVLARYYRPYPVVAIELSRMIHEVKASSS